MTTRLEKLIKSMPVNSALYRHNNDVWTLRQDIMNVPHNLLSNSWESGYHSTPENAILEGLKEFKRINPYYER